MYHFLSAMVDGPGYLPLGWKPKEVFNFTYFIFPSFSLKMLLLKYLHLQGTPEELVNLLQWCSECAGYKAPRAHHCRKCGRYKIEFVCNQIQMSTFSQILNHCFLLLRCVQKMDHHCPWINNCVGHFNHGHFSAFLISAVLGYLALSSE